MCCLCRLPTTWPIRKITNKKYSIWVERERASTECDRSRWLQSLANHECILRRTAEKLAYVAFPLRKINCWPTDWTPTAACCRLGVIPDENRMTSIVIIPGCTQWFPSGGERLTKDFHFFRDDEPAAGISAAIRFLACVCTPAGHSLSVDRRSDSAMRHRQSGRVPQI